MSLENHKWFENVPEVISELGSKIKNLLGKGGGGANDVSHELTCICTIVKMATNLGAHMVRK